jgi:hypothetical protein
MNLGFPVEFPVGPEIQPEIPGGDSGGTENQTGDFRFEPNLGPRTNRASPKTCLGLAELVRSNGRLKPEIPG